MSDEQIAVGSDQDEPSSKVIRSLAWWPTVLRLPLGWRVTARDDHGWVQACDQNGGVGPDFQTESWYQPPTWPEQREARVRPAIPAHGGITVLDAFERWALPARCTPHG